MRIEFTSKLSGTKHVQDLNVTEEQIKAWNEGALVQHAFPHLSAKERDYFVLGTTPQEWENFYGEGVEDTLNLYIPPPESSFLPQYVRDLFGL